MGKKRTWRDRRKKGGQDKKAEFFPKEYVKENKYLENYYRQQIPMEEAEYKAYFSSMLTPLPVCLRVNYTLPNYQVMLSKLMNLSDSFDLTTFTTDKKKEKMDKLSKEDIQEIKNNFKVISLKLYPEPLVYELNIARMILKKHPVLDNAHKFIQKSFDSGLLSRQELVSMIPPILLDIQAHHRVLDMCASPGSKTAQIVEIMLHNTPSSDYGQTQGLVIANDADYTRAYMLTHQLKRLNSANIIITNQMGQNFPCVYEDLKKTSEGYESRFLFDRIMCDVPCTSDGAIRKIPKKWSNWKTNDSYAINPLQLSILNRSFSLTKVGGILSYSTCSMSPIEDEAVVITFLKKFEGLVELVDCSSLLTGIKYRNGMIDWKILFENSKEVGAFIEYKSPLNLPKNVKESMFPDKEYAISHNVNRCVRILPHDDNSGGFFIAVFKKLKEFKDLKEEKKPSEIAKLNQQPIPVQEVAKTETKEQLAEETKEMEIAKEIDDEEDVELPENTKGALKINAIQILPIKNDDPDIEYIVNYYGIEKLPLNRLYATGENYNKILYVTEEVQKFITASKGKINIINMGVTMFVRNKSAFSNTDCIYRISQESVRWLVPFMTKRVFHLTYDDALKLLKEKDIEIKLLNDEALKKTLLDHPTGCFVLRAQLKFEGRTEEESLVCHKYKDRITVLLSDLQLFNIRTRFGIDM